MAPLCCAESMYPKVYVPGLPFFRLAVKSGADKEALALLKNVFCLFGCTDTREHFNRIVLCSRPTGVDGIESETKETIVINIVGELGANLLCELDGLAANGSGANLDSIRVDVAASTATVTVRDFPSVPGKKLRRRRQRGIVYRMAIGLTRW